MQFEYPWLCSQSRSASRRPGSHTHARQGKEKGGSANLLIVRHGRVGDHASYVVCTTDWSSSLVTTSKRLDLVHHSPRGSRTPDPRMT